jgi:hypothetical protein
MLKSPMYLFLAGLLLAGPSVDGNQVMLPVDRLTAGVYFVRISNRTQKVTKRMVITGK